MARFDAGPKLMQFHQYGYHGVPFLIEDVSDWLFSDNKTDVERRNYYIRQSLAKAYRILAEAYGEYFTGRDDALASLIFARFKLKVVEKKIALNIKILVVYDGVENKTIKIRKSADAKIFYIRQRPSRLSHEWEIYVNPDILAQKPTAETDELLSKLFELKTAKNPISYRIERLGYCTWDSQNDIGKVSRIGIIAHVPSKPKTVGTKPGKVLVTKKELHISVVISDKISLSPGEAETAGIAKGEDLTGVDQKLAIEVAKEKKDAIDRGVEAVDTILPALEKLEEYVVRMQTAVHRILDESDKDIKKIAGVAKEPETAGKIATNEGYIAYMAMLINMIPNIYTYRGYLKAVDQLQQFEQSLAAYSRLLPAAAVSVEAQMAVGEVLHEALQGHPAGSLARDLEAQLAETSRKIQEEIERTETLARKEADNRKAKLEAEKELEKIRRERLKRLILRRRLQLNRYVTGFFHNINMRTRYIVLRIRNNRRRAHAQEI
ncbi:MAG: hypothetical protein QS98_C0008G0035 [archaeon GW2011_AR3]|nr:MAG: hypothetical protein QS98_C0008G0035 [archaeon GW2011_AR3]